MVRPREEEARDRLFGAARLVERRVPAPENAEAASSPVLGGHGPHRAAAVVLPGLFQRRELADELQLNREGGAGQGRAAAFGERLPTRAAPVRSGGGCGGRTRRRRARPRRQAGGGRPRRDRG